MGKINFLDLVLRYERQGMNRQAIQQLIKPELEAIDKKKKEIREAIETGLKSLGAIDGTKAVNAICPTQPGADNAAKQALSRRRTWLKGLLTKTHKDYDFSRIDGVIFAEYIGSAQVREANDLLLTVQRLVALDLITADDITRDDIISGLKSETISNGGCQVLEIDTTTVDALTTIGDRITAISTKLGETNQEAAQANKEEKQA